MCKFAHHVVKEKGLVSPIIGIVVNASLPILGLINSGKEPKMSKKELKQYECVINIQLNPVRHSYSKKEFIDNLLDEYNEQCDGLFEIHECDLKDIRSMPKLNLSWKWRMNDDLWTIRYLSQSRRYFS